MAIQQVPPRFSRAIAALKPVPAVPGAASPKASRRATSTLEDTVGALYASSAIQYVGLPHAGQLKLFAKLLIASTSISPVRGSEASRATLFGA